MVDRLLLIAYSLNMFDILTVSIITPTVTGEFKKWVHKATLDQFKDSVVPFCDIDLQLRSISDDAVNLKILENRPQSSVPINVIVELGRLEYIFQYNMAYGGGDINFIKTHGEPPDFYSYLKTRLMIIDGDPFDIDPFRWSHCIEDNINSKFLSKKMQAKKLYKKLYEQNDIDHIPDISKMVRIPPHVFKN